MSTTTAPQETFTETEATDEALLLFVRKMRRLHPAPFAEIWSKLPDGAKAAIEAGERRADTVRDAGGKTWAVETDEDGE